MSVRTWQAHFSDFAQLLQTGQKTVAPARLPTMVCWPATEMGAALALLADKSGLPMTKANRELSPTRNALPPPQLENPAALDRWVGLVAEHLGLEAEPIQSTYTEAATCLAHAGPALLQLPTGDVSSEPAFVALVQGGRRYHQLITRDGSLQSVRHDVLRDALWADIIGSQGASIGQLLQNAGIAAERRPRVQRAILQEMLGTKSRHNGWLLRITPRVPLWQQTQQANLLGTAARLVTGYFAQLLLTIGAWWMIGQSTLVGHFEWGWLLGWALLLLTTVPFQAWVNITQNELAIGIGAVFKQRLLFGVLQLDPEEIRHQGAGQFLGRVLASDTVEQLGLASGFISILALFQLVAAVFILALGIGGWFHGLLLLLWVGLTIGLSAFYLHRSRLWAESHREMTNDLVERMVGHRTRLAQEEQGQWHTLEDQILGHYLQRQRQLDQVESQLKALVPRGWMAIGVGSLLYALLFTHPTATQIALSLGGILFAYQALTTVMLGLKSLVSTRLAWQEIRTIFHAATRIQAANHSVYLPHKGDITADATQSPIVTVRDVAFRYQTHGRPVLQGCNLELYRGDRLLIEGPSGGGKSTLAAILAGLRMPQSGLLLLHNVDQQTMGLGAWREQVVAVPQFHENYILTGTLAFNLLMGRQWPPLPSDVAEAEALCRELGLGDLLNRMPAGMQQIVGESGWQLSHGERSRVYIARALLQEAHLLILDESFAALDPENLQQALRCVLERAPTLVVIAHP